MKYNLNCRESKQRIAKNLGNETHAMSPAVHRKNTKKASQYDTTPSPTNGTLLSVPATTAKYHIPPFQSNYLYGTCTYCTQTGKPRQDNSTSTKCYTSAQVDVGNAGSTSQQPERARNGIHSSKVLTVVLLCCLF